MIDNNRWGPVTHWGTCGIRRELHSRRSQNSPRDIPLPSLTRVNEDWLAVIVGLTLLTLVLVGAIPGSVIP